jgi:hypothetical protein
MIVDVLSAKRKLSRNGVVGSFCPDPISSGQVLGKPGVGIVTAAEFAIIQMWALTTNKGGEGC